ncbi:MAG: penicillin-binding protein activator, partial [Alphaproteobacteria bacterium]|nr:penicillin-binding protein activator [Alphaproteobacteria bacterium]
YQKAEQNGADIVLGPVFSNSVAIIKQNGVDIPVISFTSDTSVLGEGVYSMALLIEEQIKRIVKFACERGEFRIALLGPNDKTGKMVLKSFEQAMMNCPGMQLSHISLYDAKNPDLTAAVQKIAPPLIDLKDKELTEEEKQLAQNPTADRIEFDALFVFEQGVKLQQLISLLSYYDVTPNLVSFYGLATLRGQKSRGLVGAYFADLPQEHLNIYQKNYQEAFFSKPLSVSALGYDGISLVSYLSQKDKLNEKALLNEDGFLGLNGRFRFNKDGTNDRLLEMFQIRGMNYIIKVSPAEYSF